MVVFPFVPVMQMILTPFESRFKILYFIFSATLPGRVVAPPPKTRTIFKISFAVIIAIIVIVNYIEKHIFYDTIALDARKEGTTMLEKIVEIVLQAGKIYKSAGNDLDVIKKGSNVNLVTKYDKLIQEFLIKELTKVIPDAHFMCEEGNEEKIVSDGYCFIIDPIDGTTNFIKGFQHSAISVGLTKDKELYLGVVLDPDKNNIYYAEKGKGAYMNGEPIHAGNENMENSLVLFGTCPYEHEFAHQTFDLAEKLFLKSIEVRRAGSAALDICYVAAGKADFYYELILRPWDWAGATVVLREAGGIAKTADGKDVDPSKIQSYICGNKKNMKEFYEIYNA